MKLPKRVWIVLDADYLGLRVFRRRAYAQRDAFGSDLVACYELRQPKRRRKARRK